MKTNRSFLIVAALGISLAASVFAQSSRVADNAPPPPPAGGSGTYFRLDYPGSTEPNQLQTAVSYLLWVPEGVTQLRGLIVHQHGAGTTASIEGSTGAYDLQWQALAKKWDCALWSSSYHVQNEAVDLTPGGSEHWFDPRRGSEKTFLKALDEFSAKSGHSELAKKKSHLRQRSLRWPTRRCAIIVSTEASRARCWRTTWIVPSPTPSCSMTI